MVPVAPDHAADVVNRNVLPGFVTNVLPTGDFFEDQQSYFVAGIQKMTGLRIMRSANDIALKFIAQDFGVALLRPPRHRLPDVGKGLMTIKATQLDHFAVQLKPVIGELRLAKTEPARILVQGL